MTETIFEPVEVEEKEEVLENEEDEYLKQLLDEHTKIEKKPAYTKEECVIKDEIKLILYERQKLTDTQIGRVLGVERSTIVLWRYKRHLVAHNAYKLKKGNEVNRVKHDYPKTERELQLVREFLIKAIARNNGNERYFSFGNAREEMVQSET